MWIPRDPLHYIARFELSAVVAGIQRRSICTGKVAWETWDGPCCRMSLSPIFLDFSTNGPDTAEGVWSSVSSPCAAKKYKTYVGICDAYVCEVETNFVFLLKFYASTQPLQREGSLI